MKSDEIAEYIERITDMSSKNDTGAYVRAVRDDEDFKRVLEYAYNPFKVYGIAKRPEVVGAVGANQFNADTWKLLDALAARRFTGNGAIERVRSEMSALSPVSSELFWRIIKKDLRAGFSENTINKAIKGLIPVFPYMRCCLPKDAKLDKFSWGEGVFSQEKADGMFANVSYESGGIVTITSRQGSEFPQDHFESFIAEVRARLTRGTQYHGEFLIEKAGHVLPRELGNGILNSLLNGGNLEPDEDILYKVWDAIPLSAVTPKGKFDVPYAARFKAILADLENPEYLSPHIRPIPTRVVHSMAEAHEHYRELLAQGLEGTVFKSGDAIWKDGTSKEQVKLKLEVDVDLRVVAIRPGSAGTKNEGRPGAFGCESSCGKLKVDVTIKNEALRDEVEKSAQSFVGGIIAVRANAVMKPSESNSFYSLFLPRMIEAGTRSDKSVADTCQQVCEQFEAATK